MTNTLEEIERLFLKGKHEGMEWSSAEPIVKDLITTAKRDALREVREKLYKMKLPYTDEHGSRSFYVGGGAQMRMDERNSTIDEVITHLESELIV